MTDMLHFVEGAVAELPEAAGQALKFMGDEIAKLGGLLEALSARIDKLEAKP